MNYNDPSTEELDVPPATDVKPWEQFQKAKPWELFKPAPKAPAIALPPQGDPGMSNTSGFLSAVANNPKDFLKSIPGDVFTAAAAPGKMAYLSAADALSKVTGDKEYGGNLETPGGENYPVNKFIAGAAKDSPKLAATSNIGAVLPEFVSMSMVNPTGAAGRVLAAGFGAQMAKGVVDDARELGTEMGKPSDQQDAGKIAQLRASIITSGLFAGLAGSHAAKGTPAEPSPRETISATPMLPSEPPAANTSITSSAPGEAPKPGAASPLPTEPPGETITPKNETKQPVDATKPPIDETIQPPDEKTATVQAPPAVSDYEQYMALTASLKGKSMDGVQPILQQIEAIKNRNGGMPPKPPVAPEGVVVPVETPPPAPAPKLSTRQQAKQFTDLVKEHADNQKWAQGQTLEDLHTPHPGKTGLGTMGIKGSIAIGKATKMALRNAAKDIGLDPDQIGKESYRAKYLNKLQQFVTRQPSAVPRLRPGEKGTGDLLQNEQPFNLAGEHGVDTERLANERADEEANRQANEQFQADQPQLIGQGPGGKTRAESSRPTEPTESHEGTALKNAVADFERATHGYPKAPPTEKREMAARWEEARETLYQDPGAGRALADQLIKNPAMGLTDAQSAILLHHKVDVENAMNAAAEKTWTGTPEEKAAAKVNYARESDHFQKLLDAVKQRGTHWGREGRWRQALAFEDYSFASQERLLRASKKDGAPLTDQERTSLMSKIKELEKNQAEMAQNERTKIDEAVNEALRKVAQNAQPKIPPYIVQIAERIGQKLHAQADESRNYLKGKFFTLSPDVIYHLSRIGADVIYETGLDFAKWSARMVGEFQDKIKPHLAEVYDASKKVVEGLADSETAKQPAKVKKAVKQTVAKTPDEKITNLKQKIADNLKAKKENSVSVYVQRLARLFYENGVRGRNGIVDAVHNALKDIDPNFTREDAVRAFSGYGKFSPLSKDQVTVALRGYKGELQQVEKLRDMAQGIPPHKTGIERRTPTEQEKKLIAAVNRAKVKFQVPITDPATQLKSALDTRKAQLETQIKDYTDRLANKEFDRPPRRDLKLDRRAAELTEQRDRIKQKFVEARIANERANRTPFEKFTDTAVDWARAVKLLSPTVFPKLVVAGLTRVGTNPLYRAAGLPLKLIPGLSEKAPAELNWSTKALAKNVAAVLNSAPQAWRKLTTGHSNVDVIAGKMARSREMSGIIGNAHGMIKEPVRQGAYARSLQLRTEAAIQQGLDPHDPVVQTSIVDSAIADAFREIFMNENAVTKYLFRLPLSALRQSDMSGARLLANTMEFIMPIVNIPTNIAIHTARLNPVIGFGEAATRLAMAAKRGELGNKAEKLTPQDAESISRAFKAGMIGTVLAAYAWQHPELFGGVFDEKGKKRDLKPGQMNIFGVKTPTWMGHAPEMQFLNQVAAARRVYDRYVAKDPKDKANAATELLAFSVMAPVKNLPLIDNLMRIFNTYQSGGQIAGQMTRDALLPTMGTMNAYYDSKNWLTEHGFINGTVEPHRQPKTFAQEWEMGIPGMRKNVPSANK
jgi:hypothetical protein